MKIKKLIVMLMLLAVTGTITVFTTGCGTVAEDSTNVSTRPWNTPKSWEGPLPSTFNEGR